MGERKNGVYHSNQSIYQKRIGFHSARNQPSSSSNGGGKFAIDTLNSKNENGFSKSENGDVVDHGLDPELSFNITFRKIGAGLQNLGNTCFLNSVLQCLTYTEPFAAYLQNGNHKSSCQIAGFCALCAIQNHVRCALQSTGRILAPRHLVTNIRCISRNFRYARQEDAHEYMVHLLESMHKCCLPLGFPSESPSAYEKSLVYKIFGGRLRSQVKCTECLHGSNKYDPFLDLSIEIAKADSLLKALRSFTGVEELDGGEKQYHCQRCNGKVRATRQLMIHNAPYVLTVHLKRFGSFSPGEKINKRVEFGPTLDLKPFVTGTHEGDLKYTLYGVLVHAGWSTHSGHYYCFVRTSSGMWYVLNDNEVFQVKEKTVLEQKAYMLFYVRDRRIISPKKTAAVRKENVEANDMNNIEQPVPIFGSNDLIENEMLGKESRGPVSASIANKADEVACSVKESILKNPCSSKSGSVWKEGPDLSADSVDCSFKKVLNVLSAPNFSNNKSSLANLPKAASSVVKDGGSLQINSSVALDGSVSHPCGDNNVEIQKREETTNGSTIPVATDAASGLDGTMKDFTSPVDKHRDCSFLQGYIPKTLAEGMEHMCASVTETLQSKVSCQVSELRPDEDSSVRLSSQSGNAEAPHKKISDSDSVLVGSTQFSSQLSNGEVLCMNIDLVPTIVDSMLSSQASTEVVCKEVTDSGSGFVASTPVSKQLVTEEALCKSMSDLQPEEVGLMPSSNGEGTGHCQVSDHSHKETLRIKVTEVSNMEPEQIDSTLSSQPCSGLGNEVFQVDNCFSQAVLHKESDIVTDMCGLPQLSSQLITEEALSKGVPDIESEQVDFTLLPNHSGVGEVASVQARADGLGIREVTSLQLSDQLGIQGAMCKRARDLVTGEDCSTPLSSRHCMNGNSQDGIAVNESHSTEPHSAEMNAPEREESKSVVALTQLGIPGTCGLKEPLSHPECQKVRKSRKHLKSQVSGIHLRWSLMLRASMWIHKKKKHRRNRKYNFDNGKSSKKNLGKDTISDMDPSTSEKTRMDELVLSHTRRRKSKSGANNGHDRTAASELMESYSECVSKTVGVERVDHSNVLLSSTKLPVEALTTNSCDTKGCDKIQSRSSVNDFMNLLTRGLEDTTVGRWDQRDARPSEIFGSTQYISIGYVPDKCDVEYDLGKRKKVKRKNNGFSGSNPFQEIAEKKDSWKKARMNQSSSGSRPFRI